MENEKVSIIIPIYNVEKFIHKCVDSVLNQTYNNLEVILVDDGSPDRCPVICDEYAALDDRVHVFHKLNGGLSSARNFALDHITGEYISFIDSDDTIEPNMIEIMIKRLISENGDVAICLEDHDNEKDFEGEIYKNILEDKIGSQVWRYIFKASIFSEIRFPVGRYVEDIAVMHKVLYGTRIVYIPQRFYHYYYDNGNSISNAPKNVYKNTVDRAIAFADRYEWAKNKTDITNETKQIILSKAVCFCLSTFCRCKKSAYNVEDIDYLYCFLKSNKREVKKLKLLSTKKKYAVQLLLCCPKLFMFIGPKYINKK